MPPVIDGNASGESALLLHCNGDDGSTAISDSGADTLEVTAQGGAIISTAQSKFGGSSVFLPGSGSCLRITGDLAFGTGDFTVDAWLYMTGGGAFPGILEIGAHLATTGVLFLANAGGALYSAGWNGTLTVPLNEWVHVAWVREGGVLTVYVNGTSTGSSSFTNDLSDSATITIGNKFSNDPNYNFTGWIDELRIASSAVWSANFTPPTSPYASSSATTMLQRRGAAAELENITLGPGQIAYETDTGKVKIGDGSTVYSDLDYISDGGGGGGEYLPLAGGTMEGNIVFDETGGQFIGKGLVDTSRGGSYGISLVCSVGYQFNWQAGWVLATEQNGSTPRPLYLDSAAGTTLRVWDAAENEGVE
ncbi:MAG: LamG domain-containing protein, partial [Mycobacteriaceae bacterium]|nr:LamG domain-containing protein [Mycobacteriaceae bacterium]